MEFEQMEIEENKDNTLIAKITPKTLRNKKSKTNYNLKKISIFSIFLLTILAFIFLYNLSPNFNPNIFTLENSNKSPISEQKCEVGYKLVNGKCVINYSLKASYVIQKDIEQVELIKLNNPEAILELIIEGKKVKPTNKYIFQKKGKYTVHMLLDMEKIDSIDNLFFGSISFASIYFTELFNIEKYNSMTGMFRNCKSLHTADLSKLNTKNIKKMDFLFSGCTALTSVDISHFSNENLISMSRMFHHCKVLESLDLSNFKTPKVEDMSYAFADCNKILKLDLSSFQTKNVKNMKVLFDGVNR